MKNFMKNVFNSKENYIHISTLRTIILLLSIFVGSPLCKLLLFLAVLVLTLMIIKQSYKKLKSLFFVDLGIIGMNIFGIAVLMWKLFGGQ